VTKTQIDYKNIACLKNVRRAIKIKTYSLNALLCDFLLIATLPISLHGADRRLEAAF
jgi:hypothetical protein